jgi:hypothetical protein
VILGPAVHKRHLRLSPCPAIQIAQGDPVEVGCPQADLAQKTPLLSPGYGSDLAVRVRAVTTGRLCALMALGLAQRLVHTRSQRSPFRKHGLKRTAPPGGAPRAIW